MNSDPYQEAIARLYELQKFGIKLGLNSTENLLKRLGDPHLAVPSLHLAGTNGKGSVGAMCEASLLGAGVRTGMYISPHLVDFCERFRLNGKDISKVEVMNLADRVWAVTDPSQPPTFFEFVTAMAFLYFAEQKVDLAIMETGMGGRLDATNLCLPRATVITNIGLEHQAYLGRTLARIAHEKAGIIKPGVPVIHGVDQPPARKVVENRALELGAPLIRRGREISFRRGRDGVFSLRGRGWSLGNLTTALVGRHQPENACLALGALEALEEAGYPLAPEHLRQGLLDVRWPGRLEKVSRAGGLPPLWLDGAHNLPAAKALVASIDQVRDGRTPLVMVVGMMADKDLGPILKVLTKPADYVVFSRPVYERAATPEVLASHAPAGVRHELSPRLGEAMAIADEKAGPGGVVLVTGSLFTVGEAKSILA